MNKLLSFKLLMYLLVFIPFTAFSQQVTGTVTDGGTNLPLAGASIIIKGTATGTTSDYDGQFSLKIDNFPATLMISSLGFTTIEKIVNSASVVNVTMQESATALDEVVISGLASSVKRTNAANLLERHLHKL